MKKNTLETKDEFSTNIKVDCGCGCSTLEFYREYWDDIEMITISHFIDSYYANQQKVFGNLWERIKLAWCALIGKRYYFYEIVLDGKEAQNFNESMNYFVNNCKSEE